MSFGGPPQKIIRPTPPDRGSFPLDHEGECKGAMVKYLECLEANLGNGTKCRGLSKGYLECRMQRKLMDHDEWPNLGFHEPANGDKKPKTATPTTTSQARQEP